MTKPRWIATYFNFILNLSPRQIFFADALGALLTASIVGILLVRLYIYLNIDKSTLYVLALIALLLFTYSSSMVLYRPVKWQGFMRILSLANGTYCLLTLGMLLYYKYEVTLVAVIYFVAEAILVTAIALTEWLYVNKNKERVFGAFY